MNKKPLLSDKEKELSNLLFNDVEGIEDESSNSFSNEENENFETSFISDLNNDSDSENDQDVDDDESNENSNDNSFQSDSDSLSSEIAPAWHDSDDDNDDEFNIVATRRLKKLRHDTKETKISSTEYQKRLRENFSQIQQQSADWAKLDKRKRSEEDSDSNENNKIRKSKKSTFDISKTTAKLTSNAKPLISLTRLKDVNIREPNKAVIQAMEFHPNGAIVLTSGLDKTLRLFKCDGVRNEKLRSVFYRDLPMYNSAFINQGDEIISSGRRKFLYSFDLQRGTTKKIQPNVGERQQKSFERMCVSPDGTTIALLGRDGYIDILNAKTKQWRGSVKMNGISRAVAFASDGYRLYSAGSEARVYEWDLRQFRTINRWKDDASLGFTTLALTPNNNVLACGTESGYVSLFDLSNSNNENNNTIVNNDTEQWLLSNNDVSKTAFKELSNLTTPITELKFDPTGSILAFASNRKKDSLRLYDVQNQCVYPNFPRQSQPLHYVSKVAFAPNSGYMAVANAKGKAMLWRNNRFK